MTSFIELPDRDGQDVFLNIAHIIAVSPTNDEYLTRVTTTEMYPYDEGFDNDRSGSVSYFVSLPYSEVVKRIKEKA